MTRRSVANGTGASGRSSLLGWVKRAVQRPAPADQPGPSFSLEELEPRMLLSVTPIAEPDFVIFGGPGPVRPADSTSPVGLTPATVRHAYGFDSVLFGSVTGDGAGQTIAIVDAYNAPTIAADLHAFDVRFGLSDPVLTILGQTGTASLPGTDPAGPGDSWAVETSLDVEWAHAAAPKANILLVEARSDSESDLLTAVDTARRYAGVSVVSLSWGESESSGEASLNAHFTTPAGHTGVTFVASSGDSGAYLSGTIKGVEYPAASPNVLSVGGTRLTVDASGNYVSESGWGYATRSASLGGSGGGISRYVAKPAYQNGVETVSGAYRGVPDVSLVADPQSGVAVFDSWDFGSAPWAQIGGTSLAAPLWAGLIALADQGRALAGKAALDGATGTLPGVYALPASDFHDITTGNNGFPAGAGYDLVTGRGTPLVSLVAAGLAGVAVTVPTTHPTISTLTASPSSTSPGTPILLTANNVVEAGGVIDHVAFYRESNGASGLQTTTDTFVGNGTLIGSNWLVSVSTAGLAAGSYVYYAVATDAAGQASSAVSTTTKLTAATPAVANDAFAAGTPLTGTSLSVTGTNVGATKEAGEPNHAGNVGGRSVWYAWTAMTSGKVTLDTRGSSFDTLLAVYTGSSVSTLTGVASNDDDRANHLKTSALTFNAVAGTTYHIAVDGYGGASGTIMLNLSQTAAPANDLFASALRLSGATVTWTGSSVGATKETGEPNTAANSGGASVWFTWTAPSSGTVSLNTRGSTFDTLLGVYTGSSVSSVRLVASNDDDTANHATTSALSFTAVAGTTYAFVVDGYNGASGSIVLNLSEVVSAHA